MMNYDDAVRLAALERKNGWVVVQDTAWEGYERNTNLDENGYGNYGIRRTLEQLKRA